MITVCVVCNIFLNWFNPWYEIFIIWNVIKILLFCFLQLIIYVIRCEIYFVRKFCSFFWVKVWNEFFGIIYSYFIISCTRIYGDFIAWNISVFTFVTVNVCIIYCKYNIAVVLIRIGPEITCFTSGDLSTAVKFNLHR